MNLSQQCTSLELSQKLKALGAPQESLFYWSLEVNNQYELIYTEGHAAPEDISAYTCNELGEMLPWEYSTSSRREKGWYICGERSGSGYGVCEHALTEVDARAKMLIHLLTNGLIKL